MSSTPSVSLIIPVGDRSPTLERCLDSVRALDPAPTEVILVLDGLEGDGLPPPGTGWTVEVLDERTGPAAARNAGARLATGDVLLFLDADVAAPPDLVGSVRARFATEPGLTAVMGSYDDAPADPAFLSQYRNLLHHFVHQTSATEASTFWGACGAVRRSAFEEVGGFDEVAFAVPSVEDIELGYRLRERGRRLVLDPTMQVKHLKRWTALEMIRTDVLRRGVPWTRLLLRRGRAERDLNLTLSGRLAVALAPAPLAAAALGRPWIAAAALGVVVLLDLPFLRFLRRRRGLGFSALAAGWRWLFHLYAGVAFLAGAALHAGDRLRAR